MTDGGSDHIEFLGSFEALDDPRQQAKVLYPLPEILLLCLCAVLGGADSWVEVALYGQRKLGFLRRFFPFAHGVPSHDQLGNVFARLDAQQFQSCFIAWVERFTTAVRGVVAVDGKTLRRSFDRAAEQGPIHMISAWSSQQRLVLGQCKGIIYDSADRGIGSPTRHRSTGRVVSALAASPRLAPGFLDQPLQLILSERTPNTPNRGAHHCARDRSGDVNPSPNTNLCHGVPPEAHMTRA